jgi:hypothetical protein
MCVCVVHCSLACRIKWISLCEARCRCTWSTCFECRAPPRPVIARFASVRSRAYCRASDRLCSLTPIAAYSAQRAGHRSIVGAVRRQCGRSHAMAQCVHRSRGRVEASFVVAIDVARLLLGCVSSRACRTIGAFRQQSRCGVRCASPLRARCLPVLTSSFRRSLLRND